MQLPGAAATGPLGSPTSVRKEEDYEDFWTENGVGTGAGGKAGNNGGGMSENTMSESAGGGFAGGAGARGAKGTSGKDDEWENW